MFVNGSVNVEFGQPPVAGDVLGIRDEGLGLGQINVVGTDVRFTDAGGVTKSIGSFSGGVNGVPLTVSLTGFATIAAVQALVRNLTYDNNVPGLTSAPRYVKFAVTDDSGFTAPTVVRTVEPIIAADVLKVGPVIPALRTTPVGTVDVVLANPIDAATFTSADLTLTRTEILPDGTPLTTTLDVSGVTITAKNATTYQLGNLTPLTAADGAYTITVSAATIRTFGGTPGMGSAGTSWTTDATPPTVTIDQAATQTDPTTVLPIEFDVLFSENVTGFTVDDVILTGTAGAKAFEIVGSGKSYIVRVTQLTSPGTVTAAVRSGAATDAAGNPSLASTSTDDTVDFQAIPSNEPPTITAIDDRVVEFSGNTGPIPFTVGDDNTPPDQLIVRAFSNNPVLVPSTGIVLVGTGANRSIVVAPTAGRTGTATITVTVEDSTGLQALGSVRCHRDRPSAASATGLRRHPRHHPRRPQSGPVPPPPPVPPTAVPPHHPRRRHRPRGPLGWLAIRVSRSGRMPAAPRW